VSDGRAVDARVLVERLLAVRLRRTPPVRAAAVTIATEEGKLEHRRSSCHCRTRPAAAAVINPRRPPRLRRFFRPTRVAPPAAIGGRLGTHRSRLLLAPPHCADRGDWIDGPFSSILIATWLLDAPPPSLPYC
jgi:hypothetical protein